MRVRLPAPTMTSEKSPLRNFWNLFFGKNRETIPELAVFIMGRAFDTVLPVAVR